MKILTLPSFIFILIFSANSVWAADGLPRTWPEFKERCQTAATTPEGAVKMYFDAVFAFIDPATRTEAVKMLRYIMYTDKGWETKSSYATFVSRLKDPSYQYVFRSFASGATPQNNYQMNPNNYRLTIKYKRVESDFTTIGLVSSGADSARNVWVQKQGELWYVINNAGSYSSIRPPEIVKTGHDPDYD